MNSVAAFVDHVESTRKRRVAPGRRQKLTPVEAAMDDARRRAVSGNWEASKGSTFVGLHCICHKMIYGVPPLELEAAAAFRAATRIAAKTLNELFGDDPNEMAAFVRWSWEKEKRKNNWAQANQVDRNRLSWKWQFGRALVTDYRIALTQKRA